MIVYGKKNFKEISLFLKDNWSNTHILTKNKKVFDWLHYNFNEKSYTYFYNKNRKKINAFLGIIKNSKFSKNLIKYDKIWLSTWVATGNVGIGLKLIEQAKKDFSSFVGTIGCNNKAKKLYKFLSFSTGRLQHYFLINLKLKKFKLIKIKNRNKFRIKKKYSTKFTLSETREIKFGLFNNKLKNLILKYGKDEEYFKNKYIKNPFYNYKIFILREKDTLLGYFFARVCKYNSSKCLRIVDYFGYTKYFFQSSLNFQTYINKNNYEFVDVYIHGIKDKKKYFNLNKFSKETLIPNFFEPFVKKNIKINYAIYPRDQSKKVVIFKGDCDQERPTIL